MEASLNRAIAYVKQHGTPLEKAQLAHILEGISVPPEIVDAFFADQQEDGSWSSFWSQHAPSIDATCYHLLQAEQMGLLNSLNDKLVQTIAFLKGRQCADGHWDEQQELRDIAPPWAKPGDEAAILYLTANCGLWLARQKHGRQNGQRASTYLLHALKSDGTLPSFLHTQWLAASLWYFLGQHDPADRIFVRLQQLLEENFSAGNLVWLSTSLQSAGIPPTHPLLVSAKSLLEHYQREDGSWTSDDGASFDIRITIEAIGVLWEQTL